MKLRIAKKISLARSCGGNCHFPGTTDRAFDRFARGMRKGSRSLLRWYPEMAYWSEESLRACGADPTHPARLAALAEEAES